MVWIKTTLSSLFVCTLVQMNILSNEGADLSKVSDLWI